MSRISKLIELFSEKYNKPIIVTNLKPGEKLLETLINKSQSARVITNYEYKHIKSVLDFTSLQQNIAWNQMQEYDSNINLLSKLELKDYLIQLHLL